jgi:Zn-dependent protease
MFRKAFRLPLNLAGIPLYVDLSFVLILPLMVGMIAGNLVFLVREGRFGIDPDVVAHGWMPLLLGLIGALGLFVCIILHELGHSITARRYGVKVRRITLWFLGGVAEFEEMPRQPGAEAIVAIAGPIVSFALAGAFWGLTHVIPKPGHQAVWLVCWYLKTINFWLGLFNLLPALPLDGGRILRSLLALKLPYLRATTVAGNIAKFIAVTGGIFWGLGLYAFLRYGVLAPNPWWIVLAFFIYSAANGETQHAIIVEMLKGIGVRELMNRDVRTVPAWATVGDLLRYMLAERHKGFPVVDQNGHMVGMVEMSQLYGVDPATPVWQVMTTEVLGINHRASALDAFTQMSQSNVGRLIVFDDQNNMAGIITQHDLLRAIQVRMMGLDRRGGAPSPMAVRHAPGPFSPPPDFLPPTDTPAQAVVGGGASGAGAARPLHTVPPGQGAWAPPRSQIPPVVHPTPRAAGYTLGDGDRDRQ